MIRMIQSTSASHAKSYFSQALAQADYFIDGQELVGTFEGELAKRLGLEGKATSKEDFYALCDNINPLTGKNLTPRTKGNRTVGYDCSYHAPKSVSILNALASDNHILDAFENAVGRTMKDIERDAKTKINHGPHQEFITTGNFAWGKFTHLTARPVEGRAPDPHLHTHCFLVNATWDQKDGKIKAGQFRDIKRDLPFYQALFQKRLADNLMDAGYKLRRTATSFEIEGVPQQVINMFSKRTDEIGRVAKEQGITDAKQLDKLGALTRSKKQKGMSMAELKADWKRQIQELGSTQTENAFVRYAKERSVVSVTADQCIDHTLNHCFERASVMQERRLLAEAYRFAIGYTNVSESDINKASAEDERIIRVKDKGGINCTTREVIAEEKQMVTLARNGVNKLKPLYSKVPELTLKDQQATAVKHVLTSSNMVSIIRGAAGSGKTTLMQEAVKHIKSAGKKVIVAAPTSQASRGVLKEEGFKDATTVSALLIDERLQDELEGQVLWLDEAGLLGTKDMKALLELTTRKNARLILGGDTRQHASVVRGDALRILNTVAGIEVAEVNKIHRQKEENYRSAVEDLSKGNVGDAFGKLDQMGAIQAVDPLKPNEALVADYVRAVKKGKSALVISPTHKQSTEVTEAIRKQLRASKLLGKREIKAARYSSLNLTEAQKNDWRNYQSGQVVQFNQNVKGIKRGSVWSIGKVSASEIELTNADKKTAVLPLQACSRFDVFNRSEISVARGDKVFITKNAFDIHDKRLNNGQMLKVISVSKKKGLTLENADKSVFVLDNDFGHIAHAHCITSYSSQGKTVDEVFIAQPAATFPATDAKQFYVSVSRAREKARIYTDDKDALLHHASQMGDRQSGLELILNKDGHNEHIEILQRQEMEQGYSQDRQPQKTPQKDKQHVRDYGPEL